MDFVDKMGCKAPTCSKNTKVARPAGPHPIKTVSAVLVVVMSLNDVRGIICYCKILDILY